MEGRVGDGKTQATLARNDALVQDSLRALIALGYTKHNARAAIQKVLEEHSRDRLSAEALIRESLKQIQYV